MSLTKKELQTQTAFLTANPMDRVPKALKDRLNDEDLLFDVHSHVFNAQDLPDKFLSLRFDAKKITVDLVALLVGLVDKLPFIALPDLSRLLSRIRKSEEEHLKLNLNAYGKFGYTPIFNVLMMDMSGIWNVKAKIRTVEEQMIALASFRDHHPDKILPFVALDPRTNDNMEELFVKAFKEYNYFGVKIYPSLGYLPSHPRLMNIFDICEQKNIPVTTHCSSGKTRASSKEIDVVWIEYENGKQVEKNARKVFDDHKADTYKDYFNGPERWLPVLQAYPRLRLNLAHFGGEGEWEKQKKGKPNTWIPTILDILKDNKYPNVYSDFSFTNSFKHYNHTMKDWMQQHAHVRDNILHGTDYFLTATERPLERTLKKFFKVFSKDEVRKMGVENVKKFLF
ncbi:MAG: amidohydrolase family protein [Bacteroidota bacterium]